MRVYRHSTRINVVYSDGNEDKVGPALLDVMLGKKRIDRFERLEGWVEIGIDPIRGMGGPPYDGGERRLN